MTVFDVITLFPQEITNLECFDSICFVPNGIELILPRWRDNLLFIRQLLRDKLSPQTFSMVLCLYLTLIGQSHQHRVSVFRRHMLH